MTAIRSHRRGFTLTELLVVIGIIILLVSIGLPSYFAVRRNSDIARTRLDLRAIEMGLEEYKRVFHVYPRRVVATNQGANFERILFKYLVSNYAFNEPGEAVARFGIVPQLKLGPDNLPGTKDDIPAGKSWGPFVAPDKFKVFQHASGRGLSDRFGREIQYYPKWYDNVDLTLNNTLLGDVVPPAPRPIFNQYDGEADNLQTYWMLGAGTTDTEANPPNRLPTVSALTFKGPFMLISSGPDRAWGLQSGNKNRRKCDDVYNFERP